jgi:3',5'-cyclic AMP phosphodiesterase CpdA
MGGLAAAWVLPDALLADPYRLFRFRGNAFGGPVRFRGRVRARGRGLARVGVTDGFTTVATDFAGDYTLEARPSARFVSLVLPSGYRIPTTGKGTAALHRPLQPGSTGEAEQVFELEPLGTSDAQHAFLLLADPQTQNRLETERLHRETVPDVRATVARLGDRPTFGVSCGDIMYDDLTLYPEYERAVSGMGIPFFQVVGNHDLDQAAPSDRDTTRTFERHFGPTHYAFNRGEVHYVVLDDVLWYGTGYVGYLDADQLDWLASDLKLVPPGATVVVALHIPVESSMSARTGEPDSKIVQTVNNRDALYRLLEPYRAHVLAGHTHELEHRTQGRLREHIHGTVCGAWWSGEICWDGTPNGYEVYQVNGSDLRWEYRATGQEGNPQFRVYPQGTDPSAPTDIVANVWDWDPAWKVVWYENGERRGAMSRRLGRDPRSVKEQTGPDRPPRRAWVEPVPTGHLFYAAVSSPSARVVVEATDPWGRVHRSAELAAARR